MLKLSVMSLSYQRAFRDGTMDLWGYLDESRRLDVDGVDLHMRLLGSYEPEHLKEVKRRCLQLGFPIACLNVSNNFARPAADMPAQVALGKQGIDLAALLGTPQVRLFAGVPANDDDRQAAWQRCVAALKECADYGYQQGVQVCLQNHNHGALTENGRDVLALVEQAGPHLGHVWDTGQYVGSPGASRAQDQRAQEVLYESLQQTVHLATHVRCKIYRIASGEEAWLDYPRIFRILKGSGYNGFCSIVYEGKQDEVEDVRRAVPFLRRLMAS
ncbi:MAG: sugar phosphate isomerase/epimerase family protein [Chloroflexota bacterium]